MATSVSEVACPTCGHVARTYRRRLTSVVARAVIALYRDHGVEAGHLPTVARRHLPESAHQGGYLTLGAHWNLIAEVAGKRRDGGRAGYWRVTDEGVHWVTGNTSIPSYALVRNGSCLGLEGPLVTVADALGQHFNFTELLGATRAATPPLFEPREAA